MIRGEKRSIKKDLDIEAKLHNRFDVEVRDARTGELKQKAVGYNTILNQFWTRLFANQSVYDYIQYGSGTGTPSASDTALFNWVAGVACGAYSYDDSHYTQGWNSFTRSITLDEQTAVGVNITEVGLAGAANSGLCTHALLQDMNGNSISIAKTNTDIITIYATVYIHWNVNGVNGVKYIPSSHWFGTYRQIGPSGGKGLTYISFGLGSSADPTADATNKRWTWGAPWRVPVNTGNCNGIKHVITEVFDIDISGDYQITGEAVGTGDGSTTDFVLGFDEANNIVVYVDGVEQSSGYSVSFYQGDVIGGNCCLDSIDASSSSVIHIPKIWENYTDVRYAYNPYYAYNLSIALTGYNFNGRYVTVECSNDLETWSSPQTYFIYANNFTAIRSEQLGYKYYRIKSSSGEGCDLVTQRPATKIVFSTPPAAGAVITADYKTPFLPKDIDHVYDFSLTVQLGEYSGV